MILFEIDAQRLALPPLEGDAPGAVDMDAEASGRSAEAVKIESRDTQLGQRFGLVQNFEPAQAARMEIWLNMTAAASCEQLGKTLVLEAPDHAG